MLSNTYTRIKNAGLVPDAGLHARMVRAFGILSGMEEAKRAFEAVRSSLTDLDGGVEVVCAYLDVLCRERQFDEAFDLVKSTINGEIGVALDERTMMRALDVYTDVGRYSGAQLRSFVASWKEQNLPITETTYLRLIECLGKLDAREDVYQVVYEILPDWSQDPMEIFSCAVQATGGDGEIGERLVYQFSVRFPRKNWLAMLDAETMR